MVNPAAFRNPAPGKWGDAGRNIGTLPALISVDFSVFKNFALSESTRLQFRTEFFLPNHANFRGLDRTFDATGAGELTSALPDRQIQFALKLVF